MKLVANHDLTNEGINYFGLCAIFLIFLCTKKLIRIMGLLVKPVVESELVS
ncbi:hypothetical protein D3C78_1963850 [compost metagenome]